MSTAIGTTAIGTTGSRLHLTRRGRVVFTTLAAVPVAAIALSLALNGGIAAAEGSHAVGPGQSGSIATAFDYVTIQSGQSLWQLAETIAPTVDPRDVIAEIVSLNQLASDSVQPGQRLALPPKF